MKTPKNFSMLFQQYLDLLNDVDLYSDGTLIMKKKEGIIRVYKEDLYQ